MVIAQSLFKLLTAEAATAGGVHIDVVGPPWSTPVAERMPEVAGVHNLAIPHGVLGLGARRRLGLKLRDQAYDRAIVIPGTFKSALLPLWARVPRRTGYRGEHRYGLINDMRTLRPELRSTGERYRALGPAAGSVLPDSVPFPSLALDPENRARLVSELDLTTDAPIVALCPGAAFGSSKRWPIEYFGHVANECTMKGYSVWIVGSGGEAPLSRAIVEAAPAARDLCGKTTLVDAVDLLSMAAVTTTNDSGLMHIAAAVGSHVVAVYGSTPPWFAPPLTESRSVHYAELSCSPCFKRECPLGHHDCMRLIAPAMVAADVVNAVEASG